MTREERESAVDWFAERMKQKLRKPENEAKGGWREDSLRALWHRLREETDELFEALDEDGVPWDHVIDEAADVANFAMMIADHARQWQPSGKSDEV